MLSLCSKIFSREHFVAFLIRFEIELWLSDYILISLILSFPVFTIQNAELIEITATIMFSNHLCFYFL